MPEFNEIVRDDGTIEYRNVKYDALMAAEEKRIAQLPPQEIIPEFEIQKNIEAAAAREADIALKVSLKLLIGELNDYIDKAQLIIDTPNANINSNPAAYIKDLARATKRGLRSLKDVVRLF